MRKLVTAGGLCMRDLTEQFRGNGAIKDEVAVEQLDFLHCLPAADRLRTWCWLYLIVELISVWVRPERIVARVKHGLVCIIERGVASLWILAKVVIVMRGVRRLIRLSVVSIVMGFGIHRVLMTRVRTLRIIGVVVAIGVVNVLD
jgi:hypothetical protein